MVLFVECQPSPLADFVAAQHLGLEWPIGHCVGNEVVLGVCQ